MDKIIPKFKGLVAYEEELAKESIKPKNSVEKPLKKSIDEIDPKIKVISNEKRLKSLKEKLDFDKRQQLLVKEAINDSQKRVNKRIVFETDSDFEDKNKRSSSEEKHESNPKLKPKSRQLFESDSEDDSNEVIDGNKDKNALKEFELDLNMKINDKNAEKLIELNSRFAHDLRFRIDDRFLDKTEDNSNSEEVLDEKQKNLNLLEEVLGKKFKPIIKTKDKSLENRNELFVSRFDPNNKMSSEYEVNTSTSDQKKQKKVSFNQKVLIKEVKEDKNVSNEVYYEVSSDLKQSLAAKEEEFSLTQMFGANDYSIESNDNSSEGIEKPFYDKLDNNKRKLDSMPNPFRYDSSSSDEEEVEEESEEELESEPKIKIDYKPKPFLNNFKFFFDKNDSRFSEDLFYSKESIEKAKNSWKERQRMIIRSMSVRKRSAKKNKKADKKFNLKSKYNFKRFKSN